MISQRARFLSYLDLMCCGFGGALLLFLLIAAATPPPVVSNRMLVVRCLHRAGVRAETGIEYLAPGSRVWQRPSGKSDVQAFAARSAPESGAEAFLILFAPAEGEYEFRTYLVDFPARGGQVGPLDVELIASGQGIVSQPVGATRKLHLPGDTSASLRVRVQAVR